MLKVTWLLTLSIGAGGCGTFVTETPINQAPRPLEARSPESVELFTSAPPSVPHVDVALLEVEQTHSVNVQGTDVMIRRLREHAAAMGCDAVFVSGFSEHEKQDGNFLDQDSTKMQATCIAYTKQLPSLLSSPAVPPTAPNAVSSPPPAPHPPPSSTIAR